MKKERSLGRKISYWVFAILFLTIVPLLLLEGATRVYLFAKYHRPGKSYGLWQYDKELGAIHMANGYNSNSETNDYGFRNVEPVMNPKPAGATRGIVYGGSIVFCYNLNNDEAWPNQLEKQLRANHHPADQVLNGGAICWSLGHAYRRAKRDLPALKPDYVVIYAGINEPLNATTMMDAGRDIHEYVKAGKYGEIATNLDQCRWAKRNLAIVRLLEYVVNPFFQKRAAQNRKTAGGAIDASLGIDEHTKPDSLMMENYLHVLRDFIQLVKDNGARPIFVIQSHAKSTPEMGYFTAFSETGAGLAREMGATVIDSKDIAKTYTGDWNALFVPTGVHFTALGAQEMGKFVYQGAFAPKPDSLAVAPK